MHDATTLVMPWDVQLSQPRPGRHWLVRRVACACAVLTYISMILLSRTMIIHTT